MYCLLIYVRLNLILLRTIKDTLKVFNDFKNKQQKWTIYIYIYIERERETEREREGDR